MIQILVALFGSLIGFFAQWMTKKAALGTAAVASMLVLTLGFWAAIKAAATAVLVAVPALCELSWLIPGNATACLSAVIGARIVRAIYDWHIENIKVLSYIT